MVLIKDILCFLDSEDIDYRFQGDKGVEIQGFASLSQYKSGCVTWIKNDTYIPKNVKKEDVFLLISQEGVNLNGQNTIVTNEAKRAFFSTIEHFFDKKRTLPDVGQFTYISPDVKIGSNVKIGHNCTLDGEITIGDNTVIYNNVSIINSVSIGHNCVIQSGTIIGDEGYGYTEDENHHKTMVRQYGGVSIGDDVLVGPNCTIQNGAIDDTTIGNGCKISANSFISHNVVIGEDSAIIVSDLHGSTHVGTNAYIVSSVVRNQATVGDNAFVGLGSVVTKDVTNDTVVVGVPAKPFEK